MTTPSHKWTEDPHGTRYDCERHELQMGDLTDDEMANAVFLCGDATPGIRELLAGAKLGMIYTMAAKDRIRWLSRQNDAKAARIKELESEVEDMGDEMRVMGERGEL